MVRDSIATILYAVFCSLLLFGMDRGGYHVWRNGNYGGLVYTWDSPVLDVPLDGASLLIIAPFDSATVSGIDPPGAGQEVRVYPSPTGGNITVDAAAPGTFEIFRVDGSRIASYPMQEGENRANIPAFVSSGVLFWRMGNQSGRLVLLR